MAVQSGRSDARLEVGICGETRCDPSSIEFCHLVGNNYLLRHSVAGGPPGGAHAALTIKRKFLPLEKKTPVFIHGRLFLS